MSSRDIRTYGVKQIDDYLPEDRPNQEDLFYDEPGDRLLWQLQLNRREAAQAWQAWIRATGRRGIQDLPRGVVYLPVSPLSGMCWYRYTQALEPETTKEGGDS